MSTKAMYKEACAAAEESLAMCGRYKKAIEVANETTRRALAQRDDLLSACENALAMGSGGRIACGHNAGTCACVYDGLRAAIAKARGGS